MDIVTTEVKVSNHKFLVVKGVQLVSLVWYGLLTWNLVAVSVGLGVTGLAGFWLGLTLQDRLDQRTFSRAVLVFLAALGVWLVARAARAV